MLFALDAEDEITGDRRDEVIRRMVVNRCDESARVPSTTGN
jgi:hypothetical protein